MTNHKPVLSPWQYAIIHAAAQAQRELHDRNLDPEKIKQNLRVLRLGRDLVVRLQAKGLELPQIQL